MLELQISGTIDSGFDSGALFRVVDVLNRLRPEWLINGLINLKLVDDAEIQELNKTYSGHDYATDVLSFSYLEAAINMPEPDGGQERELGDMAISLETAERQAQVAGTSLADEVATLGLHGILHIFGFDHATSQDRAAMDQLQAEILGQANVTYRDFKWVLND